jgi:hypothetical protein
MAKPEQAYYEHYLRQHRHLGAYLSLLLWHEGFDGVIIDRAALATFHELKRFTEEHLSWLMEDIKPYFPHAIKINYAKTKGKFASLVLSRFPANHNLGTTPLSGPARAQKYRSLGFRMADLSELRCLHRPFTERNIVSFLALVACGLDFPKVTNLESFIQKPIPLPKA